VFDEVLSTTRFLYRKTAQFTKSGLDIASPRLVTMRRATSELVGHADFSFVIASRPSSGRLKVPTRAVFALQGGP
jgi:hypothetical protein